MYGNGPIYASLAYESLGEASTVTTTNGVNEDVEGLKIGLSYDVAAASTVGLVYEDVDFGGDNNDQANIYVMGKHGMGDVTFKLAFGQRDEIGDSKDTGGTFFALGVAKAMSKNTELYALYASMSSDKNRAYGLKGVGGTADESATAFSLGINHKFSSK